MECCLYSLSRNIISATFTFVIFSWTIHVVLFAHFTRLSQNLLSIFFPLNSTAENDKMIEIELTTSLFQITFNRTAVWRRRYYLPSAVSFRSSSPAFVWFVLPSSNPGVYSQPLTLWLRTDDYPVLKISFLLTPVNFFFFFKRISRLNDCDELLFLNRHERRRKARAGAWSDRAIGILPCFCVLFAHFAASLASAGVKWNWIPPTGRNRSPLRSTKETQMFVTFSVWSFYYNCGWNSLMPFFFFFEMTNNN
jgi:hypothetical protein